MIPLYTPAQVRRADADAVAAGTSVATLMERAAGHLAREIVAAAGWAYGLRVAFACGKGNNGGDGIAAARRLLDAGADPVVCLVAGENGLNDLGREQLRRYLAAGGPVASTLPSALDEAHVVVDCLLGTGADGAPREPYATAIVEINDAGDAGKLVVACDLPSGVDADTGAIAAGAVRADVTVTFGAHKRGLWLSPARARCGAIALGPIGLSLPEPAAAAVLTADDITELLPPIDDDADKRGRGTVLVVAGSDNMSGAAVLCARGALAAGAGLVQVATTARARQVVATQLPEVLTLALPDDAGTAFEDVAAAASSADALVVGPGLGHDERATQLVRRLVAEIEVATVVDADGLNVFRGSGDLLGEHVAPLLCLTPHRRELGRLLPSSDQQLWDERVHAVADAAAKWDAVVVAKGAGSLVAAPTGASWINPTGSPALATGGTGDVLAGMAGALIGQRRAPEMAAVAVWLHGRAGELAAAARSNRSVTAGDVADAIADAIAEVTP